MNGRIGVQSAEGRGSSFWFTAVFGCPPACPDAPAPRVLAGVRVLVVDDHDASRQAVAAQLGGLGCRAEGASADAQAAALLDGARAAGDPFQIVLLDRTFAAPAPARATAGARWIRMAPFSVRAAEPEFCGLLRKPFRRSQLRQCLERALALEAGAQPPERPAGRIAPMKVPMRILVVDDNATNQLLAVKLVERLGCRAQAVADGVEALDALRGGEFDLVLMDCQMPRMDGFEATRRLRSGEAGDRAARMPVVAVTANAMASDREACMRAGMNDFLAKPVLLALLSETLARWAAPGPQPEAPAAPAAVAAVWPAAAPGTAVVFDEAGLCQRLMDDAALARDIARAFLHDLPRQLAVLQGEVQAGACPRTAELAHQLKGAAATVGGEVLRQTAYELEKAAKAGETVRLGALMAVVGTEAQALRQALEAFARAEET